MNPNKSGTAVSAAAMAVTTTTRPSIVEDVVDPQVLKASEILALTAPQDGDHTERGEEEEDQDAVVIAVPSGSNDDDDDDDFKNKQMKKMKTDGLNKMKDSSPENEMSTCSSTMKSPIPTKPSLGKDHGTTTTGVVVLPGAHHEKMLPIDDTTNKEKNENKQKTTGSKSHDTISNLRNPGSNSNTATVVQRVVRPGANSISSSTSMKVEDDDEYDNLESGGGGASRAFHIVAEATNVQHVEDEKRMLEEEKRKLEEKVLSYEQRTLSAVVVDATRVDDDDSIGRKKRRRNMRICGVVFLVVVVVIVVALAVTSGGDGDNGNQMPDDSMVDILEPSSSPASSIQPLAPTLQRVKERGYLICSASWGAFPEALVSSLCKHIVNLSFEGFDTRHLILTATLSCILSLVPCYGSCNIWQPRCR